jgi:hypothetical protein|tara:strand:+ start:66 stop:452 length:387 start_codon:yes stop_codon:yes gene_type:complete
VSWKVILKDELTQRVKDAETFTELMEIIKEGKITKSNGEPYTLRQFKVGINRTKDHIDKLKEADDMEEKLMHMEESYLESGHFTRANGLRQKMINSLATYYEQEFPEVLDKFLERKAIVEQFNLFGFM